MIYEIVVRVDDEKNETAVSKVVDPWMDFALLMEGLGTVIPLAAQYKEKSLDEIIEYAKKYIEKSARNTTSREELRPSP